MPSHRKVVHSAVWRFLEVAGGEVISFAVFLILARLVAPDVFGLVALAAVIIALAREVLLSGLGEALICAPENDAAFSTALWLNLAFAVVLALIMCAAAPLAAHLFNKPEVMTLVIALAPLLIIVAMAGVLSAVMRKHLDFRGFALRSLSAAIAGGLVAVPLAFHGFGMYALVAQQYVASIASVAVLAHGVGFARLARAFTFDPATARRMVRFGTDVASSAFVRFLGRRLDLAVVGMYVAAGLVGQYFFAQRVALTLSRFTVQSVEMFALPLLARQPSGAPDKQTTLTTLRWTGIVCFPVAAIAAVLSQKVILLLVGDKWAAAAPVFSILCLGSCFFALGQSSAGQILLVSGRSAAYRNLSIVTSLAAFGCAWIGIFFHGIEGAAAGSALGAALSLPLWFVALVRLGQVSYGEIADSLAAPLAAGCVGGLASFGVAHLLAQAPLVVTVGLGGLAGVTGALGVLQGDVRQVVGWTGAAHPSEQD